MRRAARITMIVVTAIVAITWLVLGAVFDRYTAPATSMRPTVGRGDALVVRPGQGAHRGDIVVFRLPPAAGDGPAIAVLRVVGIAGDRLSVAGRTLVRNGHTVREPYLAADGSGVTLHLDPITVPAGSVYLLGDDRTGASDSRNYGPVRRTRLVGRVVLVGVDLPRITSYALVGSLLLLLLAVALERAERDPGPTRWR